MWYPARYIRLFNLLSYASVLCGLLAVFAAREYRNWESAGLFIALSALADTFDGKFARLFSRTQMERDFGVNLDSLVDAISFGIVPVVCLGSLVEFHQDWTRFAWLAASFVYIVCAVTRLGFYNIHNDAHSGFIGLPTTLAALVWSTVFLIHPFALLATLLLAGVGIAMVSWIPISRPRGVTLWVYMLWFLVVFMSCGMRLAQGTY